MTATRTWNLLHHKNVITDHYYLPGRNSNTIMPSWAVLVLSHMLLPDDIVDDGYNHELCGILGRSAVKRKDQPGQGKDNGCRTQEYPADHAVKLVVKGSQMKYVVLWNAYMSPDCTLEPSESILQHFKNAY